MVLIFCLKLDFLWTQNGDWNTKLQIGMKTKNIKKEKILRISNISLGSSPLGRISFSNEEFESFATVLG